MKTITVIVETPKGSAQKYDYDKKNKWFKLKKIMPAGMVFPFDFGFIPNTKDGGNDIENNKWLIGNGILDLLNHQQTN